MIINIPTRKDYENIGFECLIQAYKNICSIDIDIFLNDLQRDSIWQYNKIVLNTSVILIHQGVESLLKSKIAEISALLLIEQRRSEWKTLPDSENVEFSDLYTISGKELLKTFYATVAPEEYPNEFVAYFENLRLLRNKLIHGTGNVILEPEMILKNILYAFTLLYGKNNFWEALRDKFYSHPALFEEKAKFVFSENEQFNHIIYLEEILGKTEMNKHFDVDFKARRYYCPVCTGSDGIMVTNDGEIFEFPNFKYTFLVPNTPNSTMVKCLICDDNFRVERKECNKDNCKGNVIYIEETEDIDEETGEIIDEGVKICLTCNEPQ